MHASSQPGILRSVVAVVAGALTGILLSIATDFLLRAIDILPSPGQPASSPVLLIATLYRTVYGILGAYLTARIAPSRPMLHVTILGSLGLLASLAGAIATWNKVATYGPRWHPLALVVLALPTAWLDGTLHKGSKRSRRAVLAVRIATQRHASQLPKFPCPLRPSLIHCRETESKLLEPKSIPADKLPQTSLSLLRRTPSLHDCG